MIKDIRRENRYIPIEFIAKENFENYLSAESFTLTLVTDGSWTFTLNSKDYCLEAPFVLCLNSNDSFSFTDNQRAAAKTFRFDPTFINSRLTPQNVFDSNAFEKLEDIHDQNLIFSFIRRNETYNGLLILNSPSAMQINAWLSVMGSECLSQSDGRWTCRIRRYLLQVLYLLEDEYLLCYEKKILKKQPIDYALEYIHSNYNLGLSLDGISKHVGLNRTTLNEHCKKKTGMTVIQYLNNYRTKMAEDALTHTNLTLNEIAVCCGYNYESYFVKTFSEKLGITPTEYRKRAWEEK